MRPTRKISRRSFLGRVAGGAVVGGGALVALATGAQAQITDSDTGAYADPAGRGRGRRTGITDSDPSDPVGRGRGRRTGITDSDPSDPAGNGRGRRNTGITDRDPSDPVGNGRGRRSCSDSDGGAYADPIGRGRRC